MRKQYHSCAISANDAWLESAHDLIHIIRELSNCEERLDGARRQNVGAKELVSGRSSIPHSLASCNSHSGCPPPPSTLTKLGTLPQLPTAMPAPAFSASPGCTWIRTAYTQETASLNWLLVQVSGYIPQLAQEILSKMSHCIAALGSPSFMLRWGAYETWVLTPVLPLSGRQWWGAYRLLTLEPVKKKKGGRRRKERKKLVFVWIYSILYLPNSWDQHCLTKLPAMTEVSISVLSSTLATSCMWILST